MELERKEVAMGIISAVMAGMGISLSELSVFMDKNEERIYNEITKEDEDEKAWLDAEVRGKEAELRAKKAPKQITVEMG